MNSGEQFKIDLKKAFSKKEAIIRGQNYRITILSDVLIRFEFSETGKFNNYPTLFALNRDFDVPKYKVNEDAKYLVIENDYFKIEYTKGKPFRSPNKLLPDSNMRVTLVNTDKVWYFDHPEVRNFKGTAFSLDDTKGNADFAKGLYSTDGFASVDDSKTYVLGENGNVMRNPTDGDDIYLFIYRRDFGACLKSYFKLTGMPPLVPRYALGIWWNKNEEYSLDDILDITDDFERNEIPFSVLLLGDYWNKNSKGNSYSFNKNIFPNPEMLVNELHQREVFLGLNINPDNPVQAEDDNYEAHARDLNVTESKPIPINVYNQKSLISFLDKIVEPLVGKGVDFFWLDSKDKKDITKMLLFNQYLFNDYKKNPKRRGIIFSRNPGLTPHRYPILYSGRTPISWKTLKLLPYYNSTASNIGVTWWSHDIGGFKGGVEDSELYTRYVQLGVYSPIFRFASEKGKFYKREPWKWDVKTLGIVKDYTRVRHRLVPYLYTEAYKYAKTGAPIIQPLYYKFPETVDEPLYKNEYYFGSELFVSPIVEPKDTVMNRVVHRIFLPNGMWYDFKTGKKFPGGSRYITFFKDEDYPVFAKSGSIIPMAVLEPDNLNSTLPPKTLEIQVFPGRSNTYNLYEDDGISSLYEEGYYIITSIDYNYRENNYTLIIRPVDGKSGIIPPKRNYKIRFRNTKFAEDVQVYVDEYSIDFKKRVSGEDFIIEISDVSTTSQLTINCKGNDIEIDAVRIVEEEIQSIISDLHIETTLKEKIADVLFSDMEIRKKRIAIRKLKVYGLKPTFVKMFIKLLEYVEQI